MAQDHFALQSSTQALRELPIYLLRQNTVRDSTTVQEGHETFLLVESQMVFIR